MKKILVLEDDEITQKIIKRSLANDFNVNQCETVDQALKAMKENEFDLYILDRRLPDGDGMDICKLIRNDDKNNQAPIIFLSGLDSESDKVIGFFSGADDYMTKPFSTLELKARVNARLKHLNSKLSTSELIIDMDSRIVKYKQHVSTEPIDLTPTEFKLLVFFIQNKERVFDREQLIIKIWGESLEMSDRVIDTHISHLRKKINKSSLSIVSYRGEGYKLVSGF